MTQVEFDEGYQCSRCKTYRSWKGYGSQCPCWFDDALLEVRQFQ